MSTHKHIDVICAVAVVLSLLITCLFMNGQRLGISSVSPDMGYENRLFSQKRVHTVDILLEDWEGFLAACVNEEYAACTVVIDGERFANVGIRGKGNTSLTTVASMDSERYSFKLEFDHYDSTKSYYGLDKLSLNNLIQDNTMMKDFLTYRLMNQLGAAAPLCSYVQIRVNGEVWGLYLAVEAIEESFLLRNYGNDYGELYKPDSMGNGGRGIGKDFQMDWWKSEDAREELSGDTLRQMLEQQGISGDRLGITDWTDVTMEDLAEALSRLPGMDLGALQQAIMGGGGAPGGIRGSADVKLQYVDDDPESYANIFGNAKTDITQEDQQRLISALKRLSTGEAPEQTVDTEAVIRYFVAHTFVCNEDSYTGSMIHNYYLYEKDGILSMLPWDYNLAFGGFQSRDASAVINGSIYKPVSGGDLSDRPMLAWIFESEEYSRLYEQIYSELLQLPLEELVQDTAAMIAPYVQGDPTKFCTYQVFETAADTLERFIRLRKESVTQQLAGEQGSVDTGELNLSDRGTMGGGMTRPQGAGNQQTPEGITPPQGAGNRQPPDGMIPSQGGNGEPMPQFPEGMTRPQRGEGNMQFPDGMTPPQGEENRQPPEGMSRPQGNRWEASTGDNTAPNSTEQKQNGLPLLLLCLAVLTAGILIARCYRRR